jgi:sulfite reductase (NADPH) flavoprotein alpha-component
MSTASTWSGSSSILAPLATSVSRWSNSDDLTRAVATVGITGIAVYALLKKQQSVPKEPPATVEKRPVLQLTDPKPVSVPVTPTAAKAVDRPKAAFMPLIMPNRPCMLTSEYTSGNGAAEHVAYALSDVAFVYPLMHSGFVGESLLCQGQSNAFGDAVDVKLMQTLGGAGAATLGALSTGVMTTTFASSQALPLMTANLHQIARAQHACVFHVSAQAIDDDMNFRSSIEDVMAVRHTGFCLMSSHTVQECHDLALVAHLASVACSRPFMHFFDGLRTSHQVKQTSLLAKGDMRRLTESVKSAVVGGDRPTFTDVPDTVEKVMSAVNQQLKTSYSLFEYSGAPDAELVIVIMGSGASVVEETVPHLEATGYKAGVLKVHLYRPWSPKHFLAALPKTVTRIAVLGAADDGEALFSDVTSSFYSNFWSGNSRPLITSGALSLEDGEDFMPHMVKAIYYDLASRHPTKLFGVGQDQPCDVARDLLPLGRPLNLLPEGTTEILILGSSTDEIVSSTKASLQVMSDHCSVHTQGQFMHDRYTDGTDGEGFVSAHVRVGPHPICQAYRIQTPDCLLVTDTNGLGKLNVLSLVRKPKTIVMLNCDWDLEAAEHELLGHMKQQLAATQSRLYTVDASAVARDTGCSIGAAMLAAFYEVAARTGLFDSRDTTEMIAQSLKTPNVSRNGTVVTKLQLKRLQYETSQSWLTDAPRIGWVPVALHSSGRGAPSLKIPSIFNGSAWPICCDPQVAEEEENIAATTANGNLHQPLGKAEAHRRVLFPNLAYGGKRRLRMGGSDGKHIRVNESTRLTPLDYDRNIFNLEFDTTGSGLSYTMGDALAVHPHNPPAIVNVAIDALGLRPEQTFAIDKTSDYGDGMVEVLSVAQLLSQVLDLQAKPSKKFLQVLAERAADESERKRLEWLLSPDGNAALLAEYTAETKTYVDLLVEFGSARPSLAELIETIPRIKARLYSIASASSASATTVKLLVVVEDWTSPGGEYRVGLCSDFLRRLQPGTMITASVKPSLMKLPENPAAPIVMAGTGTGMAPFRAFLEEKQHMRKNNRPTGESMLFFGARYSAKEFLYQTDIEAFQADGSLTYFRPAWSRDQEQKIYIQHRIAEEAALLWHLLVQKGGSFYLCGQAGKMPNDVKDALLNGFVEAGGVSMEEARELLAEMKEAGRYVIEVY